MHALRRFHRFAVLGIVISWGSAMPLHAGGAPTFSRDIQPLLARHCVVCHGPNKAEAGLRLDLAERVYTQLDTGTTAVVPGNPNASELLRRVTSADESERMPADGERLSDDDIATLRQWIQDGGRFAEHWAYQPVRPQEPPDIREEGWIRNTIDRFVISRLEAEGIAPSPQAERAILIKRLYYDLTGLPPAPADVDGYVADSSPNAWETLVDRLLASDHFGERWGRHWLDKARYADSDGYEKDRPRPNAWRYRDWVIDTINQDVPFDQFTIEQLAGDLLPNATPMQQLATAFHRQTLTNTEGGTDQEQFRVEATFDRTETTSAVWMALTMTCARCHTHKYDQITQREYYQLFAFFNGANESSADVARSTSELARYRHDKEKHDAQVTSMQKQYDDAKAALQPRIDAWTQEMSSLIAAGSSVPVQFHRLHLVQASTVGEAKLELQEDGSLLASGEVPDKDTYTLVFELPAEPLTGLHIEVLSHDSLTGRGPGRAKNGNFVLTQLRGFVSEQKDFTNHTAVRFGQALSDFSQEQYPVEGVLTATEKSGWAIAPQVGKDHQLTTYTRQPVTGDKAKYLRVVLDQQHGGRHVIGCLRISSVSGFDPVRALPAAVLDAVRTASADRTDQQHDLIAEHVASITAETATIAASLDELQQQAPKAPLLPVRVIISADRSTHVLHRGDFLQPADEVSAAALSVLNRHYPLQSRQVDKPADRLDLALWLVAPEHPLTARVIVNQVWAHLFGRGIVATQNDFGVRGDLPTHPKLLDWLAWQLPRDMNWSRKALIKTIVMSATWRQSSHHRPELQETDPTNRLLARQNRVRVEAEIVRDLHLAASGLLSRTIGGPSVFPPLPPGVAELSYANNFKWTNSEGSDGYRRGMYTFFKRTSPHPTLISFDCPDSNTTRLQRETSNTPLQALVMLNNEVYAEAAQALTRRTLAEGGIVDRERLAWALRVCISRSPTETEVDRFEGLLMKSREYYQSHPDDARKLIQRHPAEQVPPEENAAWVATVRMILNLDEFIVRG